jgi:hypothetical protein
MEAECFVETLVVMLPVYQTKLGHISAFFCVYSRRTDGQTDRETVTLYSHMITKFVADEESLEKDVSKILAKTLLGILNFTLLPPRFVQSRRHNGQFVW